MVFLKVKAVRYFRNILFFFVLGFSVISAILFLVFLVLGMGGGDENNTKRSTEFKFLQFNPTTNETSVGFVSTFDEIDDDKSIFYEDSHGNLVLLSNFGTQSYRCTGNCYCDSNASERRVLSNSITLGRGLMVLVAAVSSVFAVNLSKKNFNEMCEKNFKNDCPSHAIQSEVENCEIIPQEDGLWGKDESGNMYRSYECKGNCMEYDYFPNQKVKKSAVRSHHKMLLESVAGANCVEMEFIGRVENIKITVEMQAEINDHYKDDPVGFHHIAEVFFQKNQLHPFCVLNSKKKVFTDEKAPGAELLKKAKIFNTELPMCCGWYGEVNEGGLNHSVRCIAIPVVPGKVEE